MSRLNEMQMDTLREVCSMGTGSAATAISQLVKRRITMSVPDIQIVPVTDALKAIGDPQTVVAAVYCKILGELTGGFLLTFSRKTAFTLCDVLLDRPAGETKMIDDMGKSALLEMGNIIAGAFAAILAKMVNKNLLVSVPSFAFDMGGAVVDFVLIEVAEQAEQAVVLEVCFSDVPGTIKTKFFILPEPVLLESLFSIGEHNGK